MIFHYRVKDAEGKTHEGVVDARSEIDAVRLLRERQYFVVSVKEQKGMQFEGIQNPFNNVGFSAITDFTRQLSTMIIAGLSLVDSLELLAEQTKQSSFKTILDTIVKKIKGGGTLAEALSEHPKQFSKIYTSLVAAGEKSGKLDVVLEQLADNLEKQREFRNTIRTAMIYPVIVVGFMIAITFIMMIYVIPQLTEIYSQFQVDLPVPTKILISTSNFFVKFWWLLLAGIIGFLIWVPTFKRTELGNQVFDSILLHLPIWGSLKRDSIMGELTRTLGLLVGAGVPILEALTIVAEALGSKKYTDSIIDAAKRVEKGFPLGAVISNNPAFPAIVGQMVTVGEETGKMDETLTRVSRYFETIATEKVKRLTTALEPFILLVLGIGVAFIVLSIVLPMYQLTQAF